MTKKRIGRLSAAVALGLLCVGACAAAMPENREPIGQSHLTPDREEELARKGDAGSPGADGGQADGGPKCPYGALEDPHRGFVRCLEPNEADAGWLPPAPQQPAEADAGGGGEAPLPPSGAVPLAEPGTPSFDNGDVPHLDKILSRASSDVAKCIGEHGGLAGSVGSVKVQFLVRARGRAEGVEVPSSKGITPEAAACVRLLFKNKAVGAPTAEPVGVTVTFSLKSR